MDRQLPLPCCNEFYPMHSYANQLNEQFSCMKTKGIVRDSPIINQHLFMKPQNAYVLSSTHHRSTYGLDKAQVFPTNSSLSTMNRYLSMPSIDQFSCMEQRLEVDHPLRIHVGNIPFLWTIDDLCKQFLVFGPVKDPEIVSNERGSKGFGFITFLRHSDGLNAIRVKNGSIADGRKITVALASSRSSTRLNASNVNCYYINNHILS
ncbi:unnamed protein product [Rotaria socialis]|uniref:RRM domain-containing protein n=1 Tax=Rotaria socialis TaxID=392032 RepID=A0A820E6G6_9BILA|nr:unnamed protein product [Rotaria socialis]CAF3333722.1 unnamed protein product [Rotaria socialis]CAF4243864.1 unnamed protein product [Rotaria socialis]CAF4264655.1 unnamed protein product [Rotaria socialis]